jgi:YVTN family beta-propeller protein
MARLGTRHGHRARVTSVLAAIMVLGIACTVILPRALAQPHASSAQAAPAHRAAAASAGAITVGNGPHYLAVMGSHVYVSNQLDNTVSVIDTPTRITVATIPVGGSPSAIAVDPATNRVYVANTSDQTISVIDATTNQVIGSPIVVYVSADGGLAVDPDNNRIYVGDADGNTVTTIDGTTDTVFSGAIGVITVGNIVGGLAFDPTTHHLYVSNSADGTVTDLDANGDVVGSPIAVGPEADLSALDAAAHRLYVVNGQGNNVSVVDTASDTMVGSPIGVGANPAGIAVNGTLHHVYVANQHDNTISVIDGATATVLGTIATTAVPSGLTVDQQSGDIYATYPDAGQVGVFVDPFQPGNVPPGVTVHLAAEPFAFADDARTGRVFVLTVDPTPFIAPVSWYLMPEMAMCSPRFRSPPRHTPARHPAVDRRLVPRALAASPSTSGAAVSSC